MCSDDWGHARDRFELDIPMITWRERRVALRLSRRYISLFIQHRHTSDGHTVIGPDIHVPRIVDGPDIDEAVGRCRDGLAAWADDFPRGLNAAMHTLSPMLKAWDGHGRCSLSAPVWVNKVSHSSLTWDHGLSNGAPEPCLWLGPSVHGGQFMDPTPELGGDISAVAGRIHASMLDWSRRATSEVCHLASVLIERGQTLYGFLQDGRHATH